MPCADNYAGLLAPRGAVAIFSAVDRRSEKIYGTIVSVVSLPMVERAQSSPLCPVTQDHGKNMCDKKSVDLTVGEASIK